MRRRRRMKWYYEITLQLQPCWDRSLFEIALWRCKIDLCKLIANESDTCSLWVSLPLKLRFNAIRVSARKRAKRVWAGTTWWTDVSGQPELEDIAPSRWEWMRLWQPFSKWQNVFFCIDQLFFCLSAGIRRPSLPLVIPPSHHHNPLSSRSLLIFAGDWLSSNLRWTLTDECKLFFFLSLPLLSRVVKS